MTCVEHIQALRLSCCERPRLAAAVQQHRQHNGLVQLHLHAEADAAAAENSPLQLPEGMPRCCQPPIQLLFLSPPRLDDAAQVAEAVHVVDVTPMSTHLLTPHDACVGAQTATPGT